MTAPNSMCYKKVDCGRQNNAPLKDVHNSSSQKLWIYYREINVAKSADIEIRTVYWNIWLDPTMLKEWKRGKRGSESERFGNAALLMVKVDGATSPEMPPASESWKQPGNGSSLRTSRRCSCWCLDVGPGTPFQTGDIQKPQILSLYCLKSMGLWLFAIATNKNNDMGTSDRRVNASFL